MDEITYLLSLCPFVSDEDLFFITAHYVNQSQGVETLVVQLKHNCRTSLDFFALRSVSDKLTQIPINYWQNSSLKTAGISTTAHIHGNSYSIEALCLYDLCTGSQILQLGKFAVSTRHLYIITEHNIYVCMHFTFGINSLLFFVIFAIMQE